MAVTDHGNFDFAIELTEELLTASLLTQVATPTIPSTPVSQPQYTVTPQLTAAVTRADCRTGTAPTVALLGTVTGHLLVTNTTLPISLPPDPNSDLRKIKIDAQFAVIVTPRIGVVAGVNGLVFPMSAAQAQVTLDEDAIVGSYFVQSALILAYLQGGETGYNQARAQILTQVQGALTTRLQQSVAAVGDFLAIPEPGGLMFKIVLTTALTLKVLITVVPPDGSPALVSGMTVRRNSLGGPLDLCALAINNAHILGGIVFPALTGALGIPGTPSFPGHPCLLIGGPLPAATIGPPPPPGVPPPTVSVDMLLGQVDASGIRVDLLLRAVSVGGFATARMRATVSLPVTATIAGGALTIGLGVPVFTTTTDLAFDPTVYAVAFFTGGLPLLAALALVDAFGGGFIDDFIRRAILPSLTLPAGMLPSISLPLAGPFTSLTPFPPQTTEATAPVRSVTIAPGITIPLDRVNDVFIRLV